MAFRVCMYVSGLLNRKARFNVARLRTRVLSYAYRLSHYTYVCTLHALEPSAAMNIRGNLTNHHIPRNNERHFVVNDHGDGDMDDSLQISTLQSICEGISHERAKELLEASNGNLERAIDVFFHQQQEHPDATVADDPARVVVSSPTSSGPSPPVAVATTYRSPSSNKKKSASSPGLGGDSSRKQAHLDSFFSAGATTTSEKLDWKSTPCDEIVLLDDSDEEEDLEDVHIESSGRRKKPPTMEVPTITSEQVTKELSFQTLAETLQQLTDTTKRLVKLDVLKDFILHIVEHETDLESRVNSLTSSFVLLLGFRGSSDEPLSIGGSALSKALQTVLGASRAQLSKAYREHGDMGDVAAALFQKKTVFAMTKPRASLSVSKVYQAFDKIVSTDGRDAKQNILLHLLRGCNVKVEIRFLVRLLIGNTRVGANLKTILAALALAFEPNDAKHATDIIQKTYDICPKLDRIIHALLTGGLDQVRNDCGTIQVLTPIAPMLAHPTHSLDQVAKVMKQGDGSELPMTMEYKYDGVRCQAHFDGSTSKLFSRHMLETTAQYPDAIKAIFEARRSGDGTESFVLDAEIVGVEDHGDGVRLLPFQELSRRKKTDDGKGVRVKVFCFDLMYWNGSSYIDQPLHVRRAKIREHFAETKDFAYVTSKDLPTFDAVQITTFLEESVAHGTEGLMLKLLGTTDEAVMEGTTTIDAKPQDSSNRSFYEAGTRSHSWLKVKRDYVAGFADTIDVVPIGAWYGNGRKAQMSFLSPVLLAVYDEEEDVYRSVSRCMTFTDAMYESMREFYLRGTPYPADVGIVDVAGGQDVAVVEEEDVAISEEPDATISLDPESPMVNCFSDRPSSAYVITNESPPIWFKPMEVFEVSFADMSLSRQHTAGAGFVNDAEGRGIALRFPRFKRRRPDKRPDQATTSLQIAQMFAQQSKHYSSRTTHGNR
jgi:DNA ligase 1